MESSTVVAFRSLVMLACLIIVPLAAVLGSAFPEVVRTFVLEKIGGKATQTANNSNSGTQAPPFGQFGQPTPSTAPSTTPGSYNSPGGGWNPNPVPNATPAPPWQGGPPTMSINAGGSGLSPTQPIPGNKPPEVPQSFSAPPEQSQSPWQRPSNQAPPFGSNLSQPPISPNGLPVKQAGGPIQDPGSAMQIPVAPGGGSVMPAGNIDSRLTPPSAGVAPMGQQPERFTAIEKRLREYGATYYRLETWGDAGEFYRFHCKMAVGNNPNYTQQFEATDGDALRAMTQVLEQVESWRRPVN